MAKNTLFSSNIIKDREVHNMQSDNIKMASADNKNATLLKTSIVILLLGVGEEGHIASLFPQSPQLHEGKRLCLPVTGPKPPYKRLTVTPTVIKSAKITYILTPSADKVKIMQKALQNPIDIDALPVRLVHNAIWCLD